MACTVGDVATWMEAWAPVSSIEERDNVGLLAGFRHDAVTTVMISLDVTDAVLDEAIRLGAELLISHHPIIFRPLYAVSDETVEGRLVTKAIRSGIALYAAHTNLDRAAGGVNDALCQALGLRSRQAGEGSLARIAGIEFGIPLANLARAVRSALGAPAVRITGEAERLIKRVYVVSGSGKDYISHAMAECCDLLLTGEIDFHAAQSARALGLAVIEAGHYYSEMPVLVEIEKHLQKQSDRLEYMIRTEVFQPATCPFWFITD